MPAGIWTRSRKGCWGAFLLVLPIPLQGGTSKRARLKPSWFRSGGGEEGRSWMPHHWDDPTLSLREGELTFAFDLGEKLEGIFELIGQVVRSLLHCLFLRSPSRDGLVGVALPTHVRVHYSVETKV